MSTAFAKTTTTWTRWPGARWVQPPPHWRPCLTDEVNPNQCERKVSFSLTQPPICHCAMTSSSISKSGQDRGGGVGEPCDWTKHRPWKTRLLRPPAWAQGRCRTNDMRTQGAAGNFHLSLLLYTCTSSVLSFSLLVFELFFQRLAAMLAKAPQTALGLEHHVTMTGNSPGVRCIVLISDCVVMGIQAANITSARQGHLHQAAVLLPFCDDSVTYRPRWPNPFAERASSGRQPPRYVPFQQEISQQIYLQAIDACTSRTACLVSLRDTAPSWMNKGKRPAPYHIRSLQPHTT